MTPKKEQWKELNKAVDIFHKDSNYKKVTINISNAGGRRALQVYIEGLGACYNKEKGWCWDIFLNEDGTWSIG